MTKGFVFGKFLPFHLGHKALIEFGASKCDELTVLVCASSKESISSAVRSQWISETFLTNPKIKVSVYNYDESVLPNTSESSRDISKVWAKEFSRLLPDMSILFTSEPYGEYVAECMEVHHIPFDNVRSKVSISGSDLRESLYENWQFLPHSVKLYFQKKVTILGTESVGKSTLTDHLSNRFKSSVVHELGRDVIPDSKSFSVDQLRQIAEGHAQNINVETSQLQPLIIVDTDIHITQSYAKHTFGEYLDFPQSIYNRNRADLYLYLNKNVPYIQDGTRLDENERNKLDISHRDTLRHFGVEFEELTGTYEERNQKAYELVEELVNRF
ncbi:AAA family ATPase [Ekhidna sp.]|uniref:AAA family ATPase n=1 Tax=Ekhidna sp. TaxID=2608089 RepID=UPI00351350C3